MLMPTAASGYLLLWVRKALLVLPGRQAPRAPRALRALHLPFPDPLAPQAPLDPQGRREMPLPFRDLPAPLAPPDPLA